MNNRKPIVAVDAMNFVYAAASKCSEELVLNQSDITGVIVDACLDLAVQIRKVHQGRPVLVVDGPPPAVKLRAIEARQQRRAEAHKETMRAVEKANNARQAQEASEAALKVATAEGRHEDATKHAMEAEGYRRQAHEHRDQAVQRSRQAVHVNGWMRRKVFDELAGRGVPVFQAPGDAEAQSAYWCRAGIASIAVTNDFDAFLYGAQRVAKFDRLHFVRTAEYQVREFGVATIADLVALHVIAGRTDFAPKYPGVTGLRDAWKLLRSKSFQDLVAAEGSEQWNLAYEEFLHPTVNLEPPVPGVVVPDLYREESTLTWLRERHRMSLGSFASA